MRYDEFRNRLESALSDARLLFHNGNHPVETVELANMNRRWKIYLYPPAVQSTEPFSTSAKVAFDWNPLNSARADTCEEDLLRELLGRRQRPIRTERRWTRVDLSLYAGLVYGSTAPVPDAEVFGSWIALVRKKFDDLFTEVKQRRQEVVAVTGGCGEIEVETRCSAQGALTLKGVSISGFRIIRIPRVWDDPDRREAEKDLGADLVRLAKLFRSASDEWASRIAELARWIRYTPPPPGSKPVEPWIEDEEEEEDGSSGTIH